LVNTGEGVSLHVQQCGQRKSAPQGGASKVPTQGDKIEPVKFINAHMLLWFRETKFCRSPYMELATDRPATAVL
jgi:hypothetical protein